MLELCRCHNIYGPDCIYSTYTRYIYFRSGTLKSVLLMYSNTRAGVLDCGIPKETKKEKYKKA